MKKVKGIINLNKIGIVTKIYNTESKNGYPIIEVLLEGKLVKWAGHCAEVVSCEN